MSQVEATSSTLRGVPDDLFAEVRAEASECRRMPPGGASERVRKC